MKTIVEAMLSLRGIVSEPIRCLITRRIAAAFLNAIDSDEGKKVFIEKVLPVFLRDCEVKDGDPFVPDDLHVEATELARFCDRWMTVEVFREPGEKEWRPITADMNSLRATMVAELQALADGATVEKLEIKEDG